MKTPPLTIPMSHPVLRARAFILLAAASLAVSLAASEVQVTLLAPADGARFSPPATIEVLAEAVDPDGYAPAAELIVGNKVVAESQIFFIIAPPNGTPIRHTLRWSNVPTGTYRYAVRAMASGTRAGLSAERTVIVAPPPGTRVNIQAIDAEAAEAWQGRVGTNTALFRLTRIGDLAEPMAVNIAREGTAVNGIDYVPIPEILRFEAGRETLDVLVKPLNDAIAEDPELVRLSILPGEAYAAGDQASASATIANSAWEHRPTISLASPDPAGTYKVPTNLVLRAEASGWDGQLGRVEFRSGSAVLGVRESEPFSFTWTNAPAGTHVLTVRASDIGGLYACESAPVEIHVTATNPPAAVTIVTPAAGTTVLVGTEVPIRVTISGPTHVAHQVSVKADGRFLLGASEVYGEFVFTNMFRFPGEFVLTAVAVDPMGINKVSGPVAIRVRQTNVAPWVRLVSPERRAQLPAQRQLTVDALAGDTDNGVQSVRFYVGTNLAGVAKQPIAAGTNRYRVVVTLPEGRHVLRAMVTDNAGGEATSAPVAVYAGVAPPPDPGITLAEQPISRSSFAIGASGVLFQWDFMDSQQSAHYVTNPVPVPTGSASGPLAAFSCGFNNGSWLIEGLATDTGGGLTRWLQRYAPLGLVPQPDGVTRWATVSAGSAAQFAIGDNSELYAWGLNTGGILGLGTNAPNGQIITEPWKVARPDGVRGWRQVSATTHALAIDVDGHLYAWGRNTALQLGLGGTTGIPESANRPQRVATPEGVTWKQVAAGSFHSLGLTSSGEVYAWGTNGMGQLGVGRLLVSSAAPMKVPLPSGASRWIRVAAGANHSLAMADDGSLYGWGANNFGQVATYPGRTGMEEFIPRRIEWPTNAAEWLAFSAGERHSLAVTDEARIYRWGKPYDASDYTMKPVPGATREILAHGSNQPPVVQITSEPANTAVVLQNQLVTLRATASDPDSPVHRVDFFDGATLLASDTTAPYTLSRGLAELGRHELRARAVDAQGAPAWSAIAAMTVVATNGKPAIWITPDGPQVFEAASDAVGYFRLHRAGNAHEALVVDVEISGTATPGVDYRLGTPTVAFKAAASTTEVMVQPIQDNLVEPAETVVLRVKPSTNYFVALPDTATVTLLDSAPPPTNHEPSVRILQPTNGATFHAPASLLVHAAAQDVDGFMSIRHVTFYDGNQWLAVKTNFPTLDPLGPFVFRWTNVAVGDHVLTAVVLDDHEASARSEPVRFTVMPPPAESAFVRQLPGVYAPGGTLTVTIDARPVTNAASWAVEDLPPRGWAAGRVSDDGVFDATKGKVKFGPFFGGGPRLLSYELRAPASATNVVEFQGLASVDGVNLAIRGDRVIQPGELRHPADNAEADFSVQLAEVTAYGAAWRRGSSWPIPPNPIPVDYVTRAGFLWRSGEVYHFSGAAGSPPLCWQPGLDGDIRGPGILDFPLGGKGTRTVSETAPWVVSLLIEPNAGVSSHAVEEALPVGATPDAISHEGFWDPAARVVRWGPFMDDQSRTLTYTLNPPAGDAGQQPLAGWASFDGWSVAFVGNKLLVPNANGRPWLGVERASDGSMDLLVFGAAGRVMQVEVSTDGRSWEPAISFPVAVSPHRLPMGPPAEATQRFYRVRAAGGP